MSFASIRVCILFQKIIRRIVKKKEILYAKLFYKQRKKIIIRTRNSIKSTKTIKIKEKTIITLSSSVHLDYR